MGGTSRTSNVDTGPSHPADSVSRDREGPSHLCTLTAAQRLAPGRHSNRICPSGGTSPNCHCVLPSFFTSDSPRRWARSHSGRPPYRGRGLNCSSAHRTTTEDRPERRKHGAKPCSRGQTVLSGCVWTSFASCPYFFKRDSPTALGGQHMKLTLEQRDAVGPAAVPPSHRGAIPAAASSAG